MSSPIEQSRAHSDQRVGLVVFGSMQILAGLGLLAMAALMILMLATELGQMVASILQATAVYAILGITSMTLGIGSIL